MKLDEIKEVIELVKSEGIAELEIRKGDTLIRVVAAKASEEIEEVRVIPAPTSTVNEAAASSSNVPSNAIAINSPMAGTFYRSPAPGMPPFVEQGQRVEIGDVLCIVESMKMMNEIKSERIGTIVNIPVESGQPVASGAPIFYIN